LSSPLHSGPRQQRYFGLGVYPAAGSAAADVDFVHVREVVVVAAAADAGAAVDCIRQQLVAVVWAVVVVAARGTAGRLERRMVRMPDRSAFSVSLIGREDKKGNVAELVCIRRKATEYSTGGLCALGICEP
jgi:hypothetical protein